MSKRLKLPLRKKFYPWKRLPKRFRAGEDSVRIQVVPGYVGHDSKFRTLGDWSTKHGIRLSATMTRHQARLTLFHEVIHEALEQAGVKSEQVEAYIDAMDDQLFVILVENRKLRRFLFES